MTDREKAFSIVGYVGFVSVNENLSPRERGKLVSLAAECAGISVELVLRVRDEWETFTNIAMLALRWPVIGRWRGLRATKKAQERGAIAMTEREKAFALDGTWRIVERQTKMPHSKAAEGVARAAWKVGIEFELVAQASQESAAFIVELAAAMKPEREIPT